VASFFAAASGPSVGFDAVASAAATAALGGITTRRWWARSASGEYAVEMIDPSTPPSGPEESRPDGRCVCGEKVTIADAREITLPNGRAGWQGYCPECGAPLFAIRRRPRPSDPTPL
jgi:hypothetical protein